MIVLVLRAGCGSHVMVDLRRNLLRIGKKILFSGNLKWTAEQMVKYICIKCADHLRISPLSGPFMGDIIVTYRCNYRCPMCGFVGKQYAGKEFDTQYMISLLDDIYKLGTTAVVFSGGEPLLRKDIGVLIRHAKRKGMIVYLITNGHLLSEENVIEDVLKIPPDNINISLDSARPDTHDRLRGYSGSFTVVKEGIQKLIFKRNKKKARCIITTVTVLSEENIDEVKDIYSLSSKLEVDAVGFIPLQTFQEKTISCSDEGFYRKVESAIDFLISKKRRKGKPIVENTVRYLSMFPLALTGRESAVRCIAGYASCFVDAYGNVFGCLPRVETGEIIGNIKEKPLPEIWNSAEYNRWRMKMRDCRCCFWNCQTELNLLFNKIENIKIK